ncbi:MAG: LuxR C-terminal-related transcriptional regulator [Limisphaerales bacterium]
MKESAAIRLRQLGRDLAAGRAARRRAEAAARTWQDRFRLFLDHAPMPAFIRDEQGRHAYGNRPRAAQFGRPLAELLGWTNAELFPEETARTFDASDQSARQQGMVSGLLEAGPGPDGARRWWKTFRFPLPGPGGRRWLGGMALDVSEVILAKSRLTEFEADLAEGRLVLELLAAGRSVKEAAARLGIGPKTAEAHRAKLLRRLGTKNLVEAIRLRLGESTPITAAETRAAGQGHGAREGGGEA